MANELVAKRLTVKSSKFAKLSVRNFLGLIRVIRMKILEIVGRTYFRAKTFIESFH
jgi:hypothetical protein